MRDLQLDNYRALIMLYMVCIIHVLYWLMNAGEPVLTFVLWFEMPIIFFVSGAAQSVSPGRHGLLGTVINRLKRVVVPYYIYALVSLIVGVGLTWAVKDIANVGFRPFHISEYGWKDVVDILLCLNIPGLPYMAHLWFIPPYLIISCSFPLQKKLMERVNRYVYMAACVILFLIAQAFTDVSLLREVLCYNVFVVAGYLFYKKCSLRALLIVSLVTAAVIVADVMWLGGHFCPMQDHKFPPDWMFLTFHIFVLCSSSIVFSRIKIPECRILKIWNKRGYTIYLYQSIVFAVVAALRQHTYLNIQFPLIRVMLDSCLVFLLCTALSYLTYPLEQFIMSKLKSRVTAS